jgi:hypothetical protein
LRRKEQNQIFLLSKEISKKFDSYSLGKTPDPSIGFLKKILCFSRSFSALPCFLKCLPCSFKKDNVDKKNIQKSLKKQKILSFSRKFLKKKENKEN